MKYALELVEQRDGSAHSQGKIISVVSIIIPLNSLGKQTIKHHLPSLK